MPTKILLVDDDAQFRKLLEIRLNSFLPELSITAFANISDAKDFIKSQHENQFDLAILDQHLPDGHGTELLMESFFSEQAVLCLSSDTDPNLPGLTILAGASYFLNKINASEPLFRPLIQGLIERNKIQHELTRVKTQAAIVESVRTLMMTLRHEINNPLGALLGGAFLLGGDKNASADQLQAAKLVEQSGQRIKVVLDQLCSAVALEPVAKGGHTVFQIPGDKKWSDS